MCTTAIVAFAVSSAEGLAGGVLGNLKLNDQQRKDPVHQFDSNSVDDAEVMFLENTERNDLNDFYIFGEDDVVYEEFNEETNISSYFPQTFDHNQRNYDNFPAELAWRQYRPGALKWFQSCVKYSFYIAVLCSILVGGATVLIMFVDINTSDVCINTDWEKLPIHLQRIRVSVQMCHGFVLQLFHLFTIIFVFGWGLIGQLHLTNWNLCASFTDSVYRLYLQVYGIYNISWKSYPLNMLFFGMMLFNSYKIAQHYYQEKKKLILLVFQLGSQCILGATGLYFTLYLMIPWFVRLKPLQQATLAAGAPILGAICKAVSRIAIQNLRHINHPGSSYVLVIAPYAGTALIYRVLQAEIQNFSYYALLCIVHGLVGLLERLSVIARDHFFVWFYKKVLKRQRFYSFVGIFRTPRKQRLIADLTICNIIHEATALVFTNAFVQLYALQFGIKEQGSTYRTNEVVYKFLRRIILAISSEFVFTAFGIFILTWYLNIPVIRVWKKKWKSLLFSNMVTCSILVIYTTHYLVRVVAAKYEKGNEAKTNMTNRCNQSELLFFK